jgi:hypothetical protein
VFIFLDHHTYKPGDTVSGSVCVNVSDTQVALYGLNIQVRSLAQSGVVNLPIPIPVHVVLSCETATES